MKRRQFIKFLIPLAFLPVGFWGVRSSGLLPSSLCELPDAATLQRWLKLFADAELAKQVNIEPPLHWQSVFKGACSDTFAEIFRQLAAEDFAQNKTVWVDGWLLSEIEAFTHWTVYPAASSSGAPPVGG